MSAMPVSSNPLDFAVVPLHRLRIPLCVGSLAQPLASSSSAAPLHPDADAAVPPTSGATNASHRRGVSKHTHRWVCYLRPPAHVDAVGFYSMVQSVTFRLDRSFNDAVRVVEVPPFATSDVAWAEHVVDISISFVEHAGLAPMQISHMVTLRRRVNAEHCPLGLTATNVLSAAEPLRSLVVPDVVAATSSTSVAHSDDGNIRRNGGGDDSAMSAPPFFVSERFDSIMIVHPRRRTFEYVVRLHEECVTGRIGPLSAVGEQRLQTLAQLLRTTDIVGRSDTPDAAAVSAILAAATVSEVAMRAVVGRLMEQWMQNDEEIRARCRENSDVVLHKALVELERERSATVEEMKSADVQTSRLAWKCRQWAKRLEMRCKRMRGEDVVTVDVDSESGAA